MYELHVEKEIAIAHNLALHDGKCKYLHGHSMLITVDIYSSSLISGGSSDGMVVDFGDVKSVLDSLDHKYLNEFLGIPQPTSERVAEYVARKIDQRHGNRGVYRIEVSVQESKGQYAKYSMDHSIDGSD